MDGERIFRGLVGAGVVACIVLFVVGFAAPVLPPEIAGFLGRGADAPSFDGNATPAVVPAGGAALPDETAPATVSPNETSATPTPEPATGTLTSTVTETVVSTPARTTPPTTAPTTYPTADASATAVGATAVPPVSGGNASRPGTTGVVTWPDQVTGAPSATAMRSPTLGAIASPATTAAPTTRPATVRRTPASGPTPETKVQPTPSPPTRPVLPETTIAPTTAPTTSTVATTEPTVVTTAPTAPPTAEVTLAPPPPSPKVKDEKDADEKGSDDFHDHKEKDD